jgi:hypothetical protein
LLAHTLKPRINRKWLWEFIFKDTNIFTTKKAMETSCDYLKSKTYGKSRYNATVVVVGREGRQKVYTINERGRNILKKECQELFDLNYEIKCQETLPVKEEIPTPIEGCDYYTPHEPMPSDMLPPDLPVDKRTSEQRIMDCCDDIKEMLVKKNITYGDSSLSPSNVFDLPREAKIQARIEDKIARLKAINKSNTTFEYESYKDTVRDLIGYLILYLISLGG